MADTAQVAPLGATAEPVKDSSAEASKSLSEPSAAPTVEEPTHTKAPEPVEKHVAETVKVEPATLPDTETSKTVKLPTAASTLPVEPTLAKMTEPQLKAADPPVPAPPLTSNEASASDPAISVPVETPVAATTTKTTVPAPTVEAVPDPDEDDLDDLDELLDEFSATKLDSTEPVPNASGPGRPIEASAAAVAGVTERDATIPPNPAFPNFPFDPLAPMPVDDDDFARQLNAGMADLLGELESSPDMQRQFEQMLRELGSAPVPGEAGAASVAGVAGAAGVAAAAAAAAPLAEAGGPASTGGPPLSFQESIQRTMERMQESSETAGAAAAEASQPDQDFMAALMREMESGGTGSEEDFSKMLMGMMEQLTNKDILYEPMKELDQKFPDWMTKNKDSVPADDLKRYEEQQRIVREIVGKFEAPGYTDDNVESRQFIVDRMQKMQAAGSPPADLVGDMDAAQEALGDLDAGCPTQ